MLTQVLFRSTRGFQHLRDQALGFLLHRFKQLFTIMLLGALKLNQIEQLLAKGLLSLRCT